MAKVTLATIAKQAGLSKFAVSRSLSGKNGVSDRTRRRVQEIAASLGYNPAGAKPEIRTLGMIFHDPDLINSELHLLIQNGAQAEAERLGYRLTMRWTNQPDEIEAVVRTCSGAVLVGPHSGTSLARVRTLGRPLIRQGWLEPLEQADHIGGTDHEAGSAVADYLLSLGHTRIAYVHGTPGYRGRVERYYGVREVLERRKDVAFREMKFHAEMQFMDHLRALHAEGFHPTAFFCAHDGLALTVISEFLRLGYRIPEDVSVVGFGDYSAATQISPQLTTVKVYGQHMGAASVRLLDDRINGRIPSDIPIRVQVTSRIVERASCGPIKMHVAASPVATELSE